jgi:hypothetical protein
MTSDFFLWGFLKERVYSSNSRSLEDLKTNIKQPFADTDQQTLRKVAKNTVKIVNACLKKVRNIFSICCHNIYVTF